MDEVRPREQMRNLGVVQHGAPILREPARPFDLQPNGTSRNGPLRASSRPWSASVASTPSPKGWASLPRKSASAAPPPSSSP